MQADLEPSNCLLTDDALWDTWLNYCWTLDPTKDYSQSGCVTCTSAFVGRLLSVGSNAVTMTCEGGVVMGGKGRGTSVSQGRPGISLDERWSSLQHVLNIFIKFLPVPAPETIRSDRYPRVPDLDRRTQ